MTGGKKMRRILMLAVAAALTLALTGCPFVLYTLTHQAAVRGTISATNLLIAYYLLNAGAANATYYFVAPETSNPTPPPSYIASEQYRTTNVNVTLAELRGALAATITQIIATIYFLDAETGALSSFGSPHTVTLPTPITVPAGGHVETFVQIPQEWLATSGSNYIEDQSVTPAVPVSDAGSTSSVFAAARSDLDDQNAANPFASATLTGAILFTFTGESANGEAVASMDVVNAVTHTLVEVLNDTAPLP
jgi:hypothetical protein